MDWGSPLFVIAIIAVCGAVTIGKNWIQARHGYPLTDDWGDPVEKNERIEDTRKVELLTNENEALKGQVGRLEERISVLERIATDPRKRLSDEIDALGGEHR
ncbi:hypothetical protein KCG44_05495 [Pacificimonas sp. WHA3]|uniref:Uncharacterized protein n=1 Tax=Pacificimonas pallii TaxID=2827236 RepID=A0ABS6SD32_9SPHN|nr:hypothetical protein [Pacificimonas pallii]MBV7256236.1 hypothetical protein [Pacificimonas pallii]